MKAVGEGDCMSCGEWKSSRENGERKKHLKQERQESVRGNPSSSWYRSRSDVERMALNLKKIKRDRNREHLEHYRKEL